MKNTKKQLGFSLIEILVAVTIFGIFVALASTYLVSTLSQEQRTSVLRSTQDSTRNILELISREARTANGVFDKKNERIGHAYTKEGDSLVIFNTDLSETDLNTRKITKTEYKLEEGVLKKMVFERIVDGDFGDPKEQTLLNDIKELRILQFSFNIDEDEGDFYRTPAIKELVLKTESGEGKKSARDELRASTELRTAIVSREY